MNESPSVSLRIGAGAHRGLVREENQDRISRILSPLGEVFVVADGMGGHEGGATAAQMLIDSLGQHLRALPPGTAPDEALRQAAAQANADILRKAKGTDPRLAKMGATCVLALIQGDRAWIAHAGDSRAYLWRGGQLTRLTRDHTLVQRMVDHQILNEEEARHHPDSHVVTRSFGQTAETELEVAAPLELVDRDRLLLCSDGLSGYVDDAAIARVLAERGNPQAATDDLIKLALQAGGQDNISVQIVDVQAAALAAAPPPTAKVSESEPRRGVSGVLLLVPLILVAALAGFMLPWRSWLAPAPPAEPAAPQETIPQGASPDPTDLSDPIDQTDPFAAAGTAAVPESPAPQLPRITVVSPAGLSQPEVKQRVLREYPGNWSSPETLEDRLAGSLAQGHVYYRAGFGPESTRLAQELGYAAVPWPESLAGEHPEADILVIYGGAP
ncbi:MAG TPA: PP2C family serine/threonine-protein phosphatase [Thermoanaerobaculia bacterium]|nr:PP2C family serine/threonine-protein phosphatase [Thermoanaerobaculia bacterium]